VDLDLENVCSEYGLDVIGWRCLSEMQDTSMYMRDSRRELINSK